MLTGCWYGGDVVLRGHMWCYNVTRALMWCYNASLDGVGGGFRGQMAKQGSKQGLHSFISAPRALSLAPPLILIYFRKSFFLYRGQNNNNNIIGPIAFSIGSPFVSYLDLLEKRLHWDRAGKASVLPQLGKFHTYWSSYRGFSLDFERHLSLWVCNPAVPVFGWSFTRERWALTKLIVRNS